MSTIADAFAPVPPGEAEAPADSLRAAADAVDRLGTCSADYDKLTDAELIAGQRDIARARAVLDTRSAWAAKAVAQRSRPELGQSGLAAQQGFLSPDALIQDLTGSTKTEARKLVDVGRMLADTEAAEAAAEAAARAAAEDEEARRRAGESGDGTDPGGAEVPVCLFDSPVLLPWHAPISHAVSNGTLSVAQAHAIRTGLGDIDTVVTTEALAQALDTLLTEAPGLNVDELLKRARKMRDHLDAAGIRAREQKAWEDRYLRIWTLETGQVRINGLFPPEQGATIMAVHDALTGPRRGGVHFVDPDRAAWAEAVKDDPRSTDQQTADGFVELLKAGGAVNPDRVLGGRAPAVRILKVAQPAAQPASHPSGHPGAHPDAQPAGQTDGQPTGQPDGRAAAQHPGDPGELLAPLPGTTGHGYLEGNPAPVSRETIDRLICDSGTIDITFDQNGQPLDVGREERLFTPVQRIALAARDGGCRWGDCTKPPSMTEAHHIEHWHRDHGRTDIRLGILLCNAHHRLLHNQGWQIYEHQGRYWLRPPAGIDPGQSLIELHGKSPATG